jgi:hypothetical protein
MPILPSEPRVEGQKGFSKDDIIAIAEEVFSKKIDRWKLIVTSFMTGLGLFVIVGATWSDFRYFLLETAFPQVVAYQKLREELLKDEPFRREVANDLLSLIGDRVDSGYSKTFYYSRTQRGSGQDVLQFYALKHQIVELTLKAQGSARNHFILTIDNMNPFQLESKPNPGFPYQVVRTDISKYLQFSEPMALEEDAVLRTALENIHTLRIYPENADEASFEVLVLVRNKVI